MSYDIRVWDLPADHASPDSFEAAARQWSRLEALEPGPNPKFAALATAMRALSDDDDSPWVGDPVASAQNCHRAVWVFELPGQERARLLYAVVKLANGIGLTVLDDQLGLVFCPPDRVLPPDRAKLWRRATDALAGQPLSLGPKKPGSLAAICRELQSALDASLLPRGFVAHQQPQQSPYYSARTVAVYARSTAAGGQEVTLLAETYGETPTVIIEANVFSEAIADVVRAMFPEYGATQVRRQLNFSPSLFHGATSYVPVRSREDVTRLLEAVANPFLSILEQTRTTGGMDAILTGAIAYPLPDSGRPRDPKTLSEYLNRNFGYAALISAWLNGNDRFDAIRLGKRAAAEHIERSTAPGEMTRLLDHVLNHLREHVPRGPHAPG